MLKTTIDISRSLKVANTISCVKELYEIGEFSKKEYVKILKELSDNSSIITLNRKG